MGSRKIYIRIHRGKEGPGLRGGARAAEREFGIGVYPLDTLLSGMV